MRETSLYLFPLVALFAAGCAGADFPDSACERVAARLLECGAVIESSAELNCTPELASEVEAADCATLAAGFSSAAGMGDDGLYLKSGGRRRGRGRSLACRLGFLASCPEPLCEAPAEFDPPGPEEPCVEWARYDGCQACNYYRCREQVAQCGEEGYLLGYVGRYCDRFSTVTEPVLSPRGAEWMKKVRRCLIDELEAGTSADSSCEEIAEVGVESHATCYVQAGFCSLSLTDWFAIVHTIDTFDIPFRQILATGHGCLRGWFGG